MRDILDRGERGRLRFTRAQKEIPRFQRRRHVAENTFHTVDALGFLPTGGIAVENLRMPFPHVLPDQLLGVRQAGNNIALAIGDQNRLRRR